MFSAFARQPSRESLRPRFFTSYSDIHKLRARARILQFQHDTGSALQYSGIGKDIWRRLSISGAAWSFYRDNIEGEFTVTKVSSSAPAGKNPLDDLFGQK